MNFWHMQLHPDDSSELDSEKVLAIIKNHQIIGMGETWENDGGQPTNFKENAHIGDVVLIRSEGSPLALIRIIGDCRLNTIDSVWFSIIRQIKIIALDETRLIKDQYKEQTGKNWAEDIYAPSTFQNANNWSFLKYWYGKVTREKLMDNIKLSEYRKQELKNLWETFKNEYSKDDLTYLNEEIDLLQKSWGYYYDKIKEKKLTLNQYTNRKENSDENVPGGYLCNFLERTTKNIYGSSKPGNANNFMVKLNEGCQTYTLAIKLKKGDKITSNTKEEAQDEFDKNIFPLLDSIVNSSDIDSIIQIIEDSSYPAKQVLRKAAALNNPNDFLYIYSDDAINALHDEFLRSDEQRNLGKSHEIRLIANELLEIENNDQLESYLLSIFLWKYATLTSIADENSPNVILYGPPGTGKTYEVHNSLNYLCQGDTKRYKVIQFHPSFTYEDFIEGIKPKGVTEQGNIKFELVNGVFKKFCKDAKTECIKAKDEKRQPKAYYFVVDEINRANLSSVFGETLSLLEKNYRHNGYDETNLIKTQNAGLIEDLIKDNKAYESLAYHLKDNEVYFGVPNNLYFIGMMNDVDKSIDTFDLALRRRFKWIRKDCDYDIIEDKVKFRNKDKFDNIIAYKKCCEELNNYISNTIGLGRSYEFGHSFFMKISDYVNSKKISARNLEKLFELHLQPTLKEYLRAMVSESELDEKVSAALNIFTAKIKDN